MAQLAIKGHPTRGTEIIEILEMLGGINTHNLYGDENYAYYTIDSDKEIKAGIYVFGDEELLSFSLEEFLEKYPYKVGDKVQHKGATSCGSVFEVEKMRWVGTNVEYTVKRLWYYNGYSTVTAEDLQPYKEETMDKAVFDANAQCCDIMNHLIKKETMEGKIESFEVLESHCANEVKIEFDPSKFEIVKRDNGYYVVKKQPQYPKTYEECCEVLKTPIDNFISKGAGYKAELLSTFQKLLICRDAYWKIAGDWKPDWESLDKKYNIYNYRGDIKYDYFTVIDRCLLVFPTEEMRDAFYENFNVLIEICKELL